MKILSVVFTGILLFNFTLAVDKRLEDKSGLYAVEIQEQFGFINIEGEVVIQPGYDSVGFFSEDLAAVSYTHLTLPTNREV